MRGPRVAPSGCWLKVAMQQGQRPGRAEPPVTSGPGTVRINEPCLETLSQLNYHRVLVSPQGPAGKERLGVMMLPARHRNCSDIHHRIYPGHTSGILLVPASHWSWVVMVGPGQTEAPGSAWVWSQSRLTWPWGHGTCTWPLEWHSLSQDPDVPCPWIPESVSLVT